MLSATLFLRVNREFGKLEVCSSEPRMRAERELVPLRSWWRGLDSNQRTLARADLQSAAFNHSATSPRGQAGAPCGGPSLMCQRDAKRCRAALFLASRWRTAVATCQVGSLADASESDAGAGEGNRTLVVSLEGFCSTIELHPRLSGGAQCHWRLAPVNHA